MLYGAVLRVRPDDPAALNLLGVLKLQSARGAEAAQLIGRAVAVRPDYAEAYNNLGLAQRNLGQLAEAVLSYERAIALKPDYPEALNNLATVLREQQRHGEALAACDRAIALKPDFAQIFNNRGATLNQMGRQQEALADIDRAIALAPHLATAHFNRAVVLGDLGRHEASLGSYERALALDPRDATAWNNCGFALDALHRHEEALHCYLRTLALAPEHIHARINQGNALHELRRTDEAIAAFDRVLDLEPDHLGAWTNKGLALASAARWDEAQEAFDRVCHLDPGYKYALGNRFNAALRAGNWQHVEAWRAQLERAVAEGLPAADPFTFLAVSDSAALQLKCARLYAQDQFPAFEPLWNGTTYQHDKLRVAYLSADFHDHATAHLIAELIEHHDRSRFELSAWSFGPLTGDAMQQRLAAAFGEFHDVRRVADADVARRLRAGEIDIVIDLKGYTQDSRPEILAHRPAPAQVSYLGYPGTMGAGFIDFILADAKVIPPGHEACYSEKVLRLPNSYQPNTRREIADVVPSREDVGLPASGLVFCCFNNGFKITPPVFAVWMRLLRAVEGSVLWLLQDSPVVADRLRKAAQEHGIVDAHRIVFAPRALLPEHLARHHHADLFLDTFPYNAHTTASDALYAGVPLVTCTGGSFASRVASSLLSAAGLPELVTADLQAYEALALELALDPPRLQALHDHLLRSRGSSPLFDSRQLTADLERVLLLVSNQPARQQPPAATPAKQKAQGGTELLQGYLREYVAAEHFEGVNLIVNSCDPRAIQPGKINVVWLHHSYDQQAVANMGQKAYVDQVDHFVFVSDWQFEKFRYIHAIPESKSVVIKNAIPPMAVREKPGKIKLIYTSTPWRGLDVLLDAFGLLDRDDVELEIYSSTLIYGSDYHAAESANYEELFARARQQENVSYKGFAPNAQVREALLNAHVFAFPSTWEETSCLAAIEAAMAGCSLVTTNFGALYETLGQWPLFVGYESDKAALASRFAVALNKAIDSYRDADTQSRLAEQVRYFQRFWTWNTRADEWKAFLSRIRQRHAHA